VPRNIELKSIALSLLKGCGVALGASIALDAFVSFISPTQFAVSWLVLGASILCVTTIQLVPKNEAPLLQPKSKRTAAVLTICSGLALGLIGLMLTGVHHVVEGSVSMPGEIYAGSRQFQLSASFVILASQACIEESGVRGFIQLPLQSTLGQWRSELAADLVFVLLHFERFQQLNELVVVAVGSVVFGRLAAITQSIRWPILSHLMANSLIGTVVFIYRPSSA
jgi:membrane protease YdiL (CAAX protease family)